MRKGKPHLFFLSIHQPQCEATVKVLLRPWPIALDFKDASWKHAKAGQIVEAWFLAHVK